MLPRAPRAPLAPVLASCLALALLPVALAGERRIREVAPSEAPYAPYVRYVPRGHAGRLDWLLVAPSAFLPAFEPLVRHRRDLGLAADVVALEVVAADALLGGGDLPERLRNLVRELHAQYGLRYLVLGADSELLPSRMLPFPVQGPNVHHGEPYAGDAYFGCLDGEWNRDADGRFGEAEPQDDDEPDVRHEVHVGRVPVSSTIETETYVKKLLLYERPTHLDYQDRVIFLGGQVFTPDDAHRFYEELYGRFFEPLGFQARFFTREEDSRGAGEVLEALSEGAGVVCHFHHSFTYNLSLPRGAIDTGNVAQIGNAERPFVMFSNGCYANQFTKEGISEKLLLSPVGGAVAFIGSTNTCFTSSLSLERAFWEIALAARGRSIGEALSLVRGDITQATGVMGFLRLSFNLIGDPATRVWTGRPERVTPRVKVEEDGALRVEVPETAAGKVLVACVQAGPWAAVREVARREAGATSLRIPPQVGNGSPLRITVSGAGIAPTSLEVPDPVPVRVGAVEVRGRTLHVALTGADDLEIPVPESLAPGPWIVEDTVKGLLLRLALPVLSGADAGFVRGDEELRFPGFSRMDATRVGGLPLLAAGPPAIVDVEAGGGSADALDVETEATHESVRLWWRGSVGARWLVEAVNGKGRRLLTAVPLVNPVFEIEDLAPLTPLELVVTRLGAGGETRVRTGTTFAFQQGFPQRVGAGTTSVQLLDVDPKRGLEIVFGDDQKGLWALHADGSEVRHAGDAWTFGLFAAIEGGVFEPVLADIVGSRAPEILATSKLTDRRLYAFDRQGNPVDGFPVTFASRLMTPPLVGDFDGKRGVEMLVVHGFGKQLELVYPDGRKEPFAEIGQYNYAYPVAVDLDRDRALEVVLLDGDGTVQALDQGGKSLPGFPVALGGPGRATPLLANLDKDRALEIVALGKGSTRLAVIDGGTGEIQADLEIPGAGAPANHSLFYPGVARFGARATPSIVVGTPSQKLFVFDLVDGRELVVRDGFPLALPAEARGVAAVDVDGDGVDELFLSLHDGEVWGLRSDGALLPGFPLRTQADTYAVPLLEDLDGDGDLELFLGAADGVLRVWDLPYPVPRKDATWPGLQGGSGLPGVVGRPAARGR